MRHAARDSSFAARGVLRRFATGARYHRRATGMPATVGDRWRRLRPRRGAPWTNFPRSASPPEPLGGLRGLGLRVEASRSSPSSEICNSPGVRLVLKALQALAVVLGIVSVYFALGVVAHRWSLWDLSLVALVVLPVSLWRVGLIRFRGHFPKGGYDVQNGIKEDGATTTAAVHGRVHGRRGPARVG